MKELSIIIPFYNTKKEYFERCKKSLISQDFKDLEVIIIDDGSDEIFKKELDGLESLGYIKVIHTVNRGVSEARNLGLSLASGSYVIFLDSDDWLEIDACKQICNIISKLSENLVDVIITNSFINSGEKRYLSFQDYNTSFFIKDKQYLFDAIFKNTNSKFLCADTPWAKVYRREFLVKNNIKFNSRLKNGEDGLFNFEVYFRAENIYYSNITFYNYFVNFESTCNTYTQDLCERFLNLVDEYVKFFERNSLYSENRYFNYFVVRIICRLIRKYFRKIDNYKLFKNEIKNLLNDRNIKQALNSVNVKELEKGKKLVYFLCKFRMNYFLYMLSKSKANIK